MAKYDLAVRGGRVVIPKMGVFPADVGVISGKIAALASNIPSSECGEVIDAKGLHVFPGVVDSHFHVGIYRPFREDAGSESASAASGGVTTIMSYFRTGQNYLNKTGPYKEIFPELMAHSEASFLTDHAFHIAIMSHEQLSEVEWLVEECGVTTFKYYMFYKSLDLSGSKQSHGYLMLRESLDLGFLYRFMKEVARMNRALGLRGDVRLSVHCENPEIITATVEEVKANPSGNAMRDYSQGRPGWQEELAIREVGVIAKQTDCPINFLHLSSREAVDAARQVKAEQPRLNHLLEGTLHHLSMCWENDYGILGKVNPPVRSRVDVEHLWSAVLGEDIQTVVSDHACHPKALRQGELWNIMPGFGGTALMFPILLGEGYHRRGLALSRIAEMTAMNPAVVHGLYPRKGSLMVGADADLAIVDLQEEREVTPAALHSAQDYTPFEGLRLKGWPRYTLLRGRLTFAEGQVTGNPGVGKYLKRPL